MDKLNRDAQEWLERARDARTPTPHDKARILAALSASIGAAATVGVSTGAYATAATNQVAANFAVATAANTVTKTAPLWAKLLLPLAVATSAGVGTVGVLSTRGPEPMHMPTTIEVHVLPVRELEVEQVPLAVEPEPTQVVLDEFVVESSVRAAPKVWRAKKKGAATRAGAPASLGAELALLHQAQSAWRANQPRKALELSAEHARNYPHSDLRVERDALRVLALCDLDRASEATRLGRAWLRAHSESPLRGSVETSCIAR